MWDRSISMRIRPRRRSERPRHFVFLIPLALAHNIAFAFSPLLRANRCHLLHSLSKIIHLQPCMFELRPLIALTVSIRWRAHFGRVDQSGAEVENN